MRTSIERTACGEKRLVSWRLKRKRRGLVTITRPWGEQVQVARPERFSRATMRMCDALRQKTRKVTNANDSEAHGTPMRQLPPIAIAKKIAIPIAGPAMRMAPPHRPRVGDETSPTTNGTNGTPRTTIGSPARITAASRARSSSARISRRTLASRLVASSSATHMAET